MFVKSLKKYFNIVSSSNKTIPNSNYCTIAYGSIATVNNMNNRATRAVARAC